MADEIKATEPNPFMDKAAELLMKYRGSLNEVLNHTESGYGLGNFLVGEAPEMVQDMAYGSPPWRGKGQATVVDPRILDVVGVPIPGLGLGYGAAKGGFKALGRRLGKDPMDMSRREFSKKAAGAAGLAAGGALPAKRLIDAVGEFATPRVGAGVAVRGATKWGAVTKAIGEHFSGFQPHMPKDKAAHLAQVKRIDAHHFDLTAKSVPNHIKELKKSIIEGMEPPWGTPASGKWAQEGNIRHLKYSDKDYEKWAGDIYDELLKNKSQKAIDFSKYTDEWVDFFKKNSEINPVGDDPDAIVRMISADHYGVNAKSPLGRDPRLGTRSAKNGEHIPDFIDSPGQPPRMKDSEFREVIHKDVLVDDYGSTITKSAKKWLDKQNPDDLLEWSFSQKWPKDAPVDEISQDYFIKLHQEYNGTKYKEFMEKYNEMMQKMMDKDPHTMGWEVYLDGD